MRALAIIAATLLLALGARAAPNIDCTKAQIAAEKAICEDWRLHWSDRQLSRLYTLARNETPQAQRASLIESQRRFLATRDAYGYRPDLIRTLYHKRLAEVAALVNVHDAYATFARGLTGDLRIARFGYTGAVEITASGKNGHECQFDADDLIQTGKGLLRFRGKNDYEECRMNIIPEGDDMRVEIEAGCRFFCGHHARMDGTYTRVK